MSEFQHRKNVKARKAHACEECREPAIQPGDTYSRVFCVYDGMASTVKVCSPCMALWDKAVVDHAEHFRWGDGVVWGDLRQFLGDVV